MAVTPRKRLPHWLKRPPGSDTLTHELKIQLRQSALNTVCEEARCPNIADCFSRGTATFMILGDVCTRGCRFCSITTGKPTFLNFASEALSLARSAKQMKLKHVVITSVARDDLPDGGAEAFSLSINAVRKELPDSTIEVLVPDFRGNENSIDIILNAKPDVLNHNLETVPRLYRKVRPGASYTGSLQLLEYAKSKSPEVKTKTGIMLGLGEQEEEVLQLLDDVMKHNVDIFTAGQYMQPTKTHLEVEEYVHPDKFDYYREKAKGIGIPVAFIGPLVRSSYHAGEVIEQYDRH